MFKYHIFFVKTRGIKAMQPLKKTVNTRTKQLNFFKEDASFV